MLNRSSLEASPPPAPESSAPAGGLIARLLRPLFTRVRIDDEAETRLVNAYRQGIVVHVFRASRLTDPLFLLHALETRGLPSPQWMHDHYASAEEDSAAALSESIRAGHSAVLFLRRPRTLLSPTGAYTEKHVEALLRVQRDLDRPILLLPETLHWTKRPVGLRPTVVDSVFGNREAPGWAREIVGFLWNYKDARFHVGAPVDLRDMLQRSEVSHLAARPKENSSGSPPQDQVVARKIRWVIAHHLAREEQLRTGPMVRSMARTRQMVLKDPAVRKFIATQVHKGKTPEEVERKAEALLRGIAADMRYGWLRVLDAVLDVAWNRIYDGIVVDEAGLAMLRRAARRGPVVLMPSHKSHIDYIVLSQVFFKDDLMPPLVAAGENLNFWPMGFIFRRSGAFFIRRSFKDKLYAVVFAAYVRRLLKEGHALEFFIEGGRSRTGKLLPPRTGMLTMCVDPVLERNIADVAFIPVSISYEKIIEAGAYAQELAGGEKKKEDARGLLSSAKLLRSRYGRVYVDFAAPVSLVEFAKARGLDLDAEPEAEAEGPERKDLIVQLGHRIVNGINQVTRTTPTSVAALVLLARTTNKISESELFRRADWTIALLDTLDARISTTLEPNKRQDALREALERFAAEGQVRSARDSSGETLYRLDAAGRQTLDYYKNNILHFLVPSAVVALALLSQKTNPATRGQVSETALRISRLLKNEFSFRVDRAFDQNFESAGATLEAHDILHSDGDAWRLTDAGRPHALELAGLLAPFFEAYRLSAQMLDATVDSPLPNRKFVALALSAAQKSVAEGHLLRAEAAVQPTLKHSLSVFKAEDVIAASGGIKLHAPALRDNLVDEFTHYLSAIDLEPQTR